MGRTSLIADTSSEDFLGEYLVGLWIGLGEGTIFAGDCKLYLVIFNETIRLDLTLDKDESGLLFAEAESNLSGGGCSSKVQVSIAFWSHFIIEFLLSSKAVIEIPTISSSFRMARQLSLSLGAND